MEYINGNDLYQMFNYGTVNVLKKRKVLNDLNVFPVADSDTGNNLASTMQAITQKSKRNESFHESLMSISESALFGAKGNSGVIFAQFVNGLRYASSGKARVTIQEFSNMVASSVEFTYQALSNPVEGTMLTVIKDWANSLLNVVKKEATAVKRVFEQSLVVAKKSLELTKGKLKVLRINDVVDSGAMGFVLFLQGIDSYYNNETIQSINYEEIEIDSTQKHDETVKFRYCTEGLVELNSILDEKKLKKTLEKYGDSLIVAKGSSVFKIHIHTNEPAEIFNELRNYGKIISQKVDNMKLDIALEKTDRKQVIVTDSSADLPIEILNNNSVVVIPMNITVGGVNYFDKLSINSKILSDMMPDSKEYPTTATPFVKYIEDTYQRLIKKFDEIIVLSVASKQSGTYNVLSETSKKYNKNGKRIIVIDTLANSVTEGLLVNKASTMLMAGKTTDEIVEYIEETKKKSKIFLCLNTLKYVVKSGRISKTTGAIGSLLGMRPIASIDKTGKATTFGVAFSQKGITKKIAKLIKKEMSANGIESYALMHCVNEELANEYNKVFTSLIGKAPEYVMESSCAGTIHTGIGTVGIGYIQN
jgi:hypothetical protein